MQLTQEKKSFIQKAQLKTVSQVTQMIDDLKVVNLIEKCFKDDLLQQICSNNESDFQQEISETGMYYFNN